MKNLGNRDRTRLEEMFHTGRDSVSDEQIEQAGSRAERKIRKLEDSGIPDSLEGLWNDIKLLYGMISDSIRGRYKIPIRTIGAISFTLLYFANPFDVIPDVIPFVGYIDDAFVVSLCIKFIGTDLDMYRKWKYDGNHQVYGTEIK